MASLPPLSVIITADTTGLESGMNIAGKALKNLSIAAAAASAAVVGGLAAIAVQGIKTGKELATMAERANATPEAFQRMAIAAANVGVENDKLSDILQDVNDRIGDFLSSGGGEMADFFENIAPLVGVTAEEFAKLSGPDALQLYVSSLEKAGVNQQEMTFYLEAMASDLNTLYPLLKNNGAAMRAMGDSAAAAGNIISSEMLDKIVAADNAVNAIHSTFGTLQLRLAGELAPALENAAVNFQELLVSEEVVEAIDGLVTAFGDLAEIILSEDFMTTAANGLALLADGAAAVAGGLVTLSDNAKIVTIALSGLAIAAAALGGPLWVVAGALGAALVGMNKISSSADDASAASATLKQAQDALNIALGTFSNTAAPDAGAEAIALAKNYEKEAQAALVAAEATMALQKARISEISESTQDPRAKRSRGNAAKEELDEITAGADAAREALDSARRTLQALTLGQSYGDGGSGSTTDPKDDEALANARRFKDDDESGGASVSNELQARLDALIAGIASEREILDGWYVESKETLEQSLADGLLTREQYNQRTEELQQEHSDRMKAIAEAEGAARMQAVGGALGDLATLMTSGNKKLFKIGQAAAIANAAVSGYEAAVDAWKAGMKIGGPTVAAAFTAASLAKTGALISSIASQSASGSGSSTSTSSTSSATGSADAAASTYYQVSISGDSVGISTVDSLFDMINQGVKDGRAIGGITLV